MKKLVTAFALAALMCTYASASLMLVQSAYPTGTTSLFNVIGTFNYGNNKARLEAAGQTTLQGGNPGNGWWSNSVVRSWEVLWNNTTGTVTFKAYSTNDWTGSAAMTMTQTPVFTSGYGLVGLDIGARMSINPSALVLSDIEFNDGSGFTGVPTANATYNYSSSFYNNYHALSGTLGDFTLRGKAQFTQGTTTGDSMRFFVNARQGVIPEPATMALLAFGGLLLRRKK